MTPYPIAVLVGSLRQDSINRRLAEAVARLAPDDFRFKISEIGDLPLYNQDEDAQQAESVVRLKNEILAAKGVLLVTPEYNRSIPGVLKNAIDHASRPYGASAWKGKPGAIMGASQGATGTAMAQQHLRNVLGHLDVVLLGQPEAFVTVKDGFFDADGSIADAHSRAFLQKWMDAYTAWVRKHS